MSQLVKAAACNPAFARSVTEAGLHFMHNNYCRVETDQEKIARLEHDLAECYRLTGADPDGNEDWRLAGEAVRAVKELREELDRRDDDAYHAGIERDLID